MSDQRDALVGRVALFIAAIAVSAVAATALLIAFPSLRDRFRQPPVTAAYTEGELLDLDRAAFSSTARTLFFFSRSSCSACQASKPLMAAIVGDLLKRGDVHVKLVTSPEDPDQERLFALELGVTPADVYQTNLRDLRLRQVPTMVLADSAGKILMVREGRFTESDRLDLARLFPD